MSHCPVLTRLQQNVTNLQAHLDVEKQMWHQTKLPIWLEEQTRTRSELQLAREALQFHSLYLPEDDFDLLQQMWIEDRKKHRRPQFIYINCPVCDEFYNPLPATVKKDLPPYQWFISFNPSPANQEELGLDGFRKLTELFFAKHESFIAVNYVIEHIASNMHAHIHCWTTSLVSERTFKGKWQQLGPRFDVQRVGKDNGITRYMGKENKVIFLVIPKTNTLPPNTQWFTDAAQLTSAVRAATPRSPQPPDLPSPQKSSPSSQVEHS